MAVEHLIARIAARVGTPVAAPQTFEVAPLLARVDKARASQGRFFAG